MLRLLIMCLLGLSGIFLETSVTEALPMDTPLMEMMSMTNDAEGTVGKSKRHDLHQGAPCPELSHSHSGTYLPPASPSGHYGIPAYQKPIIIPSYHQIPKVESIGYQKPMVPKIIYQTIQRPAIHHDAHVQPDVKQQVHYVQQRTYVPFVNEQPISHVKASAPAISYENYVKPVQHVQPIPTIHPLKSYVKEIPCEHGPAPALAVLAKPIAKPMMEMHSYYSKQFFQPVSYYPKPLIQPKPISVSPPHVNNFDFSHTKVIYQKPQQSIIKVAAPVSEPGCEKIHQPQISYVKTPQPILQHVSQPQVSYVKAPQPILQHVHQPQISFVKAPQPILQDVHQPMFQYAPKYHQPMVQQPMVHFAQKVHQPVMQQPLYYFTQKMHQPEIVQQPIVHLPQKIHQPIAQSQVIHYKQPIAYGNVQHSVAPPVKYDVHNYQSPIIPCHK